MTTLRRHLLVSLALILVIDWPAVAQQDGFKLPMTRVRRNRGQATGNALTTQSSVLNKHEFAYLVNVSFGPQSLPVILDTGSSDLWVVSSECTGSDCNSIQKYQNLSSSLVASNEPFKLNYLSGSVTGNIDFETITIGSYEVSHQVFALANRTENLGLSSTGNSGIMGLTFESAASIPVTTGKTLMDNLFTALPEAARYFAFKLGRDDGSKFSESSLTFGQLDSDYAKSIDDITFTHVSKVGASDYNFWKMPLQALTIDAATLQLSTSLVPGAQYPIAVLDTGTTLILGPTADIDAFWQGAGQGGAARKNPITGFWEVHCNRSVTVGLVLGDEQSKKEYFIHPRDISWSDGGQYDGWCLGGLQANDGVNSGDWLLGDTFLRNVYTIHHGANSTHPPLIGLLGLTNPETSLAEFRAERGTESTSLTASTIPVHGSLSRTSFDPTTSYVASSLCGFMGGAVVTVLFRARAMVVSKKYHV